MNYYYDIYINMNDNYPYEFYEWMENDPIEHLRKIPVIRTNANVIKDVLNYYVKMNSSILDAIYLKTEFFDSVLEKNAEYMFLLTDTKSAIIVECDQDGYVICLSKMQIMDEINLLEISNAFKEQKVLFDKKDKRPKKEGLRIENEIRDFLIKEINTLEKESCLEKLKYIYYEWTNKSLDTKLELVKGLKKMVNGSFTHKHYQIYELIKLSYNSKAEAN